jgi:predicted porin
MNNQRTASFLPAFALGAALAVPAASSAAVQLAGDALELYGKINLSLDINDTDTPGSSTNLNVSSNTSMIGFRGQHALDPGATLLWQLEQGFRADSASGNFASRNTFLGIRNPDFGTLLAGYHDTPFKDVAKRWALMNYTVADRRMILGAGAQVNNVMNARAKNSLLYMNKVQGLEYRVMYAADTIDDTPAAPDDNDNKLASVGAWYTVGALELSAAYERWWNMDAANGRVSGLRFAATHRVGSNAKVGAIFESIDTAAGAAADLDRNAFGFNGSYRQDLFTYEAQLLIAGDHRGPGSTGAMNIGLGVTREINRQFDVYGTFSMTDNDSDASYKAVDGGHGDHVPTVNGGTPYALSVGGVFRF